MGGVIANALDILSSLAFFVGIVVGATGYWSYCRLADWVHNRRTGDDRQTKLKVTWAAGGLVIMFMAWSMVSTNEADRNSREALHRAEATSAEAKAFAEQTRECQRQLLGALGYNNEIRVDNDNLSLLRFVAVVEWFHDIAFPPANIAALDQTDPRRLQWAIGRTDQADREVRALIQQQRDNDKKRAPYPPPNCGGG